MTNLIEPTPWDATVFGCRTFEILAVTPEAMAQMLKVPGHYTIKVDPLASKKLLHEHGFYYCDTLIEAYCTADKFVRFDNPAVTFTRNAPLEALLAICHGAFEYGRFHRDFNLDRGLADLRYDSWLKQLHAEGNVYGLLFRGALAGFIGAVANKLVLVAVGAEQRRRGLGKYLWSAVCKDLFASGYSELISTISSANFTALNLYASVGFRFRNPLDVYHRVVT